MRHNVFIPEHRTNILPLRWLANYILHPISMWFFSVGLKANHQIYESNEGYSLIDEIKEKIGFRVYDFLNRAYDLWGTIYKMDIDLLDIDMSGEGWNDYDDNGIPYWDYFWHFDEETGDGWRLKLYNKGDK